MSPIPSQGNQTTVHARAIAGVARDEGLSGDELADGAMALATTVYPVLLMFISPTRSPPCAHFHSRSDRTTSAIKVNIASDFSKFACSCTSTNPSAFFIPFSLYFYSRRNL
jgi:hypothetical protein